MDSFVGADAVQRRLRRLSKAERIEEAVQFIREFAHEAGMPATERIARERQIVRLLKRTGHYDHTSAELTFGARLAWRNHARCIGRLWWKSLEVVDCRSSRTPAEVAGQVFRHMEGAAAEGHIRSTISIFSPARPGHSPTTIESPQVLQYAGYLLEDGRTLGDRKNVELTRTVMSLGWRPPAHRSAFDLLPLLIRGEDGTLTLFEIPLQLRQEVPIRHPAHDKLQALGLRWYSVPCVSNMIMTIGGIDYPCAPFNGFYMGTEIASRNLIDPWRYDRLRDVAEACGIRADDTDLFWKDRALTELNHAVIHSFRADGWDIVDHHTASVQFIEFAKLERKEGRPVSADWSWIVPPQASASCPVFHLEMSDRAVVPNFFLSRAIDGADLRVDRRDRTRNRWVARYDRLRRRWRDWRRQRDHVFQRH